MCSQKQSTTLKDKLHGLTKPYLSLQFRFLDLAKQFKSPRATVFMKKNRLFTFINN